MFIDAGGIKDDVPVARGVRLALEDDGPAGLKVDAGDGGKVLVAGQRPGAVLRLEEFGNGIRAIGGDVEPLGMLAALVHEEKTAIPAEIRAKYEDGDDQIEEQKAGPF